MPAGGILKKNKKTNNAQPCFATWLGVVGYEIHF